MARGTRRSNSAMSPRRAVSFLERVSPLNSVSIVTKPPLNPLTEVLRNYQTRDRKPPSSRVEGKS